MRYVVGVVRRVATLYVAIALPVSAAFATVVEPTDPDDRTRVEAMAESSAQTSTTIDYPRGRLPDVVIPLGYALELTVLPDAETFSGHVDIAVRLTQPRRAIFLHGNGLKVTSASVTTAQGDRIDARYRQLSEDGVALLEFEREIAAQNLAIEFDYSAPYDRKLHGLYRVDEDGHSYAFTQLESIYARQMFPGFDQPSYKTPFEITLVVRDEHVAIANTAQIESSALDGGLKRVRFATTEPLPTYLIAIAVGPLDVVEGRPIPANAQRDRAIPLRGIAARGKGGKLAYALATTGDILAPLEAYFDVAYPYDKLDILALPDFEAGAMENPGAITFRESLLLLGDDAPLAQRQAYASVMAHELAHMWFGDLVTMPWWDDIWLNESFATWMSYKAVAHFDPGQRPELARLQRLRTAKTEDGLLSARQIREPVTDSHGIASAFDGITYAKGSAVLNMFESYLGPDVFERGIAGHIKKFAGGNADVNDLAASLAAVSHADIVSSFRSFLFQPGLPQIDTQLDCASGTVTFSQSRYLPFGSDGKRDARWQVPVCLKYGVDEDVHKQCMILSERSAAMKLDAASCPDWLMPDANFAGYYQWSVPVDEYRKLVRGPAPLSELEWLSVGDSVEAGLAAGSIDVKSATDIMAPLADSTYPAVALSPTRLFTYFFDNFSDNPKVAAVLRERSTQLYAKYDAGRALQPRFVASLARDEDRNFHAKLLRFVALDAADASVRSGALALVSEALGKDSLDTNVVASDARRVALTVAVQDGGDDMRAAILAAYRNSRDARFRDDALAAMAATRNPEFAAQLRAMLLGDEMRSNEILTMLAAHFKEPSNRPVAWRWLQANWPLLAQKMPSRHAARTPLITVVFCDEDMAQRVNAFFAPTIGDYAGGPRALRKAVERITICARRVAAERAQVNAYFTPGVRR